ncbi:hypothetical protein T492DRAFT_865484 [Pavlovales sp. CCMP2436]|nr:hypothetical protein T492DRAFT_865484 [Pavlovales sp. CCMP2436]
MRVLEFLVSKLADVSAQAVTGEGTMADDEREEALLDRNDEALTEMTYAASEGDVDTVRALAARGLNLNAGDYDDR